MKAEGVHSTRLALKDILKAVIQVEMNVNNLKPCEDIKLSSKSKWINA